MLLVIYGLMFLVDLCIVQKLPKNKPKNSNKPKLQKMRQNAPNQQETNTKIETRKTKQCFVC